MVRAVLSESPIVYAHRGASAERPENTLEAFARALEVGADAIETDVHVTRDGRLVLSHDPSPARTSGGRTTRRICDASFAEVRTWDVGEGLRMPSFEEALEAFPEASFNVDAKEDRPDVMPMLVRAVRTFRAEERVRLVSFHQGNLARARALGYAGRLGMGRDDILAALFLPERISAARTVGADAVQVPRRGLGIDFTSQRTIDKLHRRGYRVEIWVVDDAEEASALVRRGVDGIITNDPRRIVPAVAGVSGR